MTAPLDELLEFLRFPSISTEPRHKGDVHECAVWLRERLARAGFESRLWETAGHPIVTADGPFREGRPTILIYGHYDVQPVDQPPIPEGSEPDPLRHWVTPPFEPSIRNGRIYGRGTADDKGQIFAHVAGLRDMLATDGDLPVNVRFLIEGEEEIGSGSLAPFIRENRERLACDVVLISDTGMIAPNLPTLTYGLRGIAAMELRVLGPSSDLHSGLFGGAIMNPLTALARVLASLHHENGRVAVPGFYDQVRPLELWERRMWENLPYGDAQLLAVTGAADLFGESGYSAVERLWARPTAEVNGVGGGFQGTGSKTVIPREAMAKLTFRLVPDQNPELILDLVEAYLRERCPLGTRIEITRGHTARPYATDPKGAWGVVAGRALEATFGTAPVMIREGGSIPIVDVFRQELGVDTLLLGLALPDCGAHGPNENFPVEHFHAGMRLGRNFLAEAVALARGAGAV